MEKAKQAISGVLGRSGQHDTTVHETVAPGVQHETVKPHQHEEINTAVDREVHQDHYHRTVQPVHDREVLPETHTAKLGDVQHREFDHRDHDTTKSTLQADQAQFQNERRVEAPTSSRSVAPTVGGEHQHHHIHETIQPVVQKETIQPNVTHTTVPIHEVHHNKATHHDTTALPAMSMDQFKAKGGALGGREERYDEFQGLPKQVGGSSGAGIGSGQGLQHNTREQAQHGDYADIPHHKANPTNTHQEGSHTGGALAGAAAAGGIAGSQHQHHSDRGLSGTGTTGDIAGSRTSGGMAAAEQHHHSDRGMAGQGNLTGSSTQGGVLSSSGQHENNLTSNRQGDLSSSHHDHATSGSNASGPITDSDLAASKMKNHGEVDDHSLPKALTEDRSKAVPHSELTHDDKHKGHGHGHDNSHAGKPSIGDKLNPKTDADGDGKAGIMD